ncbi:hypothetical protein LCGC14_2365280, partial [marine sediment metagenome]
PPVMQDVMLVALMPGGNYAVDPPDSAPVAYVGRVR